MDRRFFTWLMLTTALCFLYLSMRQQVPDQGAKNDKAKAQQAAPNADPLLRDAAEPAPGDQDAEVADETEVAQAGRPNYPERAITLGSMDPNKGFNLLPTFTTRGGGLERVELVGQENGHLKFRALENDSGYLGYLGTAETIEGLRIRTVPDGSPAAAAASTNSTGLQVDDVIRTVAGQTVTSQESLEGTLKKTKPGETIDVVVKRTANGASSDIAFSVTLSETPLDIVRMREWKSESVDGNLDRASLLTTLGSINSTRIPSGADALPALSQTLELNWDAQPLEVPGGEGITFRLPLDSFLGNTNRPAKLDLVKHYRLLPAGDASDGYILDFETVIENRNDEQVNVSFRQEGLAGLTLEGWWYSVKISPHMFSGAGNRDVIFSTAPENQSISTTRQIQDKAKKTPSKPNIRLLSENEPLEARSLRYIGVDAQYFNASMFPHKDAPDSLTDLYQAEAGVVAVAEDVKKAQIQATNVSFRFDTNEKTVAAGEKISQRYKIFLGPKDTDLLASHQLDRAIEYGWFKWIAQPLSLILHFFYSFVRNYGIAIVMLTVMVRALMFPLGRKAAMNAQRMQELQPELKRINDQYKDNMEKRAKAMQELYAKHNFKPLAGCLPMFIQLPIFIGLYRSLSVDISLRQQALIPGVSWCSNLAGPDQLLNWSSWMPEFFAGRGTGWLGPYFNILPMVTVALFLLQQQMLMPKATDDQTRMTQNMMKVMTIFMGVLFFKVPSGLCLYFVTSSLWSLVERKLVKRLTPASKPIAAETSDESPKADTPSAGKKSSKKNRRSTEDDTPTASGGKMQELMKMLEKPAVKSATQRGPSRSKSAKGNRKGKKRR